LLAVACDQHTEVARREPTSFKVDIVCAGATAGDCPAVAAGASECPAVTAPPDLGTPLRPVDRTQTFYLAQLSTIDSMGMPYAGYQGTANIYMQFEGSVTPVRSPAVPALATVPFKDGRACLSLTLPPAFNQTNLWVEDPVTFSPSDDGSHLVPASSNAAGASAPIYRPAPLISDVMRTTDPVQQTSTLNNKHVIIEGGEGGGPIVVTYVTANYFTVTDLGASGVDHPWGSMELYTFQQPYGVYVGSIVSQLNGSVQNFLGLPELNFPVWTMVDPHPPPSVAPLPAPHRIYHRDIPATIVSMAPYKSGIVEVVSDATDRWIICPLRPGSMSLASYQKYGEWLLATPTSDCSSFNETLDVVTTASIPNFDPTAAPGMKVCRLAGILSVVVPAAHINLWTITPRSPADLGAVVNLSDPCP
jgi:hypothetical protein